MSTVEESGYSKAPSRVYEINSLEVAQWSPSVEPGPATEVHLLIEMEGLPFPLVMRFKSPDTLKLMIEQMIQHRREVWPLAEIVKADQVLPPAGFGSLGRPAP